MNGKQKVFLVAMSAVFALGGSAVMLGGKVKGLFETADAELDFVTEPASARPAPMSGIFDFGDLEPIPSAQAPARNGYLSSSYMGGSGALDHMAELVDGGIVLDGETVALGALTASYHQSVAVPAGAALVAFANPEHTAIHTGGGTTHIQIGVQAASGELPQRPPVQLMLVLDTSGSMAGLKIDQARQAALGVIDALDPSDSFGLVTYSDEARIAHPLGLVGDGEAARAAIGRARNGGGTNIADGLAVAYERLLEQRNPEAITRVVLLSDGEPTQGITDPSHIQRQAWTAFQDGLQTTTLGFGVGFNSSLMMGIAREGKGNYHFVRDGAGLARVLDEELEQLTHVVAQAVRLRVELPADVTLVRVLGADILDESASRRVRAVETKLDERIARELGIASDREEQDESGLKLVIPSFHLGKHHVVMLEVAVPAGTGLRELASVEVKYKDMLSKRNETQTATATVTRSEDKGAALASLDPRVKKNLLGFQTGEAMVRAGAMVDRGRAKEAVDLIDGQMTLLAVAAERWRDTELGDDVTLLGRYKDVLMAQHSGVLDRSARGFMGKALAYNGYKLTR